MKMKTIRMTVECPYCRTAYTFRCEEKLRDYRNSNMTKPLHPACIKADKAEKKTS